MIFEHKMLQKADNKVARQCRHFSLSNLLFSLRKLSRYISCISFIFDVVPSVLVCDPNLFSLNDSITIE